MVQPYAMIPNSLFVDQRISNDTKTMIGYLMSRPESWKLHYKDIMKKCGVGRNKAYKMINEAIAAGYIERHQIRVSGLFSKAEYILTCRKKGQLPLDLQERDARELERGVPETGTRSTDQQKPCHGMSQSDMRDTVNGHIYKDLNSITITTTHRTPNVLFEENLQGEAAGAAETASLREPLLRKNTDLPVGKPRNDPKGRDGKETHRDKPQSPSCKDKIHDNSSAEWVKDENPQQGQQASARGSDAVKPDFLQKAVEKMRKAAGAAITEVMAKDFEPSRWLQGGCDLELDILPIISARCAKKSEGSIFAWSFFTKAIEDRHFDRTKPLAKVEHDQEVRARGQNTRKAGRRKNASNEHVLAVIMKGRKEREMRLAA